MIRESKEEYIGIGDSPEEALKDYLTRMKEYQLRKLSVCLNDFIIINSEKIDFWNK